MKLMGRMEGSEELSPSVQMDHLVPTTYKAKMVVRQSLAQISTSRTASVVF